MSDSISQQLKGELVARCARISSHGFTAGFDFIHGVPAEIVTTFSREWLEEYQTNGYSMHDPVVLWGTAHTGVKSWNELSKLFAGERPDVIKIARKRGMANGTVISFDLDRKRAVMGITHLKPELDPQEVMQITSIMSQILFQMPTPPTNTISDKAKRLLQAVANGSSEAEFAQASGVSTRAINALRARTLEKLGATTLSQAVLAAYRSRQID